MVYEDVRGKPVEILRRLFSDCAAALLGFPLPPSACPLPPSACPLPPSACPLPVKYIKVKRHNQGIG